MVINAQESIERALPLVVGEVENSEPFFSLYSEEPRWSLSVSCPWRYRRGEITVDSEDISVADFGKIVEDFRGRRISWVRLDDSLVDPVFGFDDGSMLSVFADTDQDPWVLSVADAPVVLVGAKGSGTGH